MADNSVNKVKDVSATCSRTKKMDRLHYMQTLSGKRLPYLSQMAASITKSISGFSCEDLHLYSVAVNEDFCQMLRTILPKYEILKTKYFTDKAIPAFNDEVRGRMGYALKSAVIFVLSCDGYGLQSPI